MGRWSIYELPVLAFIGDEVSLLVGEINTAQSLCRHSYDHTCPPYLAEIAARFTTCGRDSIVSLL